MIDVKGLKKNYGGLQVLKGVDLTINKGDCVVLVGPSGCGKSTFLRILAGLVPASSGTVTYRDTDITGPNPGVGLVFQTFALMPWLTVQANVELGLEARGVPREERRRAALQAIDAIGLDGFENAYPKELSGGMRQRVMIAMALACNPKVIIADEPTTALDVTIQAQILDLLRNLKDRINSSIMLITHDLGVIAEMADYVVVMYAGRVVEKGTAQEIFANPAHPYTIGLMASKPIVGKKVDRLYSIPGKVPNPVNMPNYCYFKDRCEMALPCCDGEYPCEISLSPTHKVSCYRYYENNRKAGE